jgi:gluconolactonase
MADYRIEEMDSSLRRLIDSDAVVTRIAGGLGFTEGPLWFDGGLLFSDIPNSRIARWRQLPEGPELTTFKTPTGNSNGLTFDREGRLIACEHTGRRVSRVEHDGTVTVLADRYQGKRLSSPNDAVVRSDGYVFFTDPPYGLPKQSEGRELPYNGVFCLTQAGKMLLLADDFERPNGLAFSPDERVLYVADTFRHHLRRFEVAADGTVSGGEVFVDLSAPEPGGPDGLKVDCEGNVWATASGGVWIVAPDGRKLGRIVFPELPANVAWGGDGLRTLFATARTSVYKVSVKVSGLPVR